MSKSTINLIIKNKKIISEKQNFENKNITINKRKTEIIKDPLFHWFSKKRKRNYVISDLLLAEVEKKLRQNLK